MSVWIRPAQPTDAGRIGDIMWQFQADHTWMPDLYSAAQTIAFCGAMIDRGWVTIALANDEICGFLARDGHEICGLYLSPQAKGRGIGRVLLDHAKRQSRVLWLRCFQANTGALRFYRREGFVEKSRGTGAETDENLPSITFTWSKETGA